jgi:2,5-dioxopentanoate dehydrogenase
MSVSGRHLIGGVWVESGERFAHRNPATGEPIAPEFCEAGAKQVDAAVAAAKSAFQATADLPPHWSAKLLNAIAAKILDLGDAILERANQETALPLARLTSERGRTVNQLKMFVDLVRDGSWLDATIDTADPNRQPLPKPDLRRMRIARGPVAVFGASNFPFAFGAVGGDTASALAAGCPVIVKGHPSHPGTSELFASAVLAALVDTGLPTGLFALLQGRAHELSMRLVQHPDVTAVGFTGSKKAGRALFDLAAARAKPIPVFAEMGSLNPLVLLPGAIREHGAQIAKDLAGSILLGGGQFCTKPGLILAIGGGNEFIAALASHLKAPPPVTMLNQALRDSFSARVAEWAKISAVNLVVSGAVSGYASVSPSLFQTDVATFIAHTALWEEAFGPAALIVDCQSVSDARQVLQHIGGSLTGSIHAGSADDCKTIARELEQWVGRIVFNGYPTGVEVCGAMMHGGPYPATTDGSWTSVGTASIVRFVRMAAYQNAPDSLLPPALQKSNPLGIVRTINHQRTADPG